MPYYPEGTVSEEDEPCTSRKRKRTIPDRFKNFLLTEKLPAYRDAKNDLGHLRALAVEVVNNLNAEFENRFDELTKYSTVEIIWIIKAIIPLFLMQMS